MERLRLRANATAALTVVVALASVSGVRAAGSRSLSSSPREANAIVGENRLAGTSDWERPPAAATTIAGYASAPSVAPGQRLHLHVTAATGVRYRVAVYRIGWYGGSGARLVACLPSCRSSESGVPRTAVGPDWAIGGQVRERWPVTDALVVPDGWTSGYYLAELIVVRGLERGRAALIPFIVRGTQSDRSSILVVAPVNTWQAYNDFGGASFYRGPGRRATEISFDRPYASAAGWPQSEDYEYPLVRFLERTGYDITYTTDVDVDADPAQLLQHRLVIVAGHSEYWTVEMRDAFALARDGGVNLAFLGGNDGYHSVAYSGGRHTIVLHDFFRDLQSAQPECELLGVEWQGGWVGDGIEPGGSVDGPYVSSETYSVNPAAVSEPWFAGTGFTATSGVPGIVGYEWDGIEPGCEPQPTVLFRYAGARWVKTPPWEHGFVSTEADAVTYTAPSGAIVFSAGSIEFSWGLDGFARRFNATMTSPDLYPPDIRLQRFMINMLDQLAGTPVAAAR